MTQDLSTPEPRSPTGAIVAVTLVSLLGCGLAAVLFVVLLGYLKTHHGGVWAVMGATAVYVVAILAMVGAVVRFAQRRTQQRASPAARRYAWRFMAAMGLYVVALVLAIGADMRLHPRGVAAYALAIAPALPLIATIVIMGLYLREETDEFQRAVQMEGALWATGGMLAVATVFGFLETFKLAPDMPLWAVFPLWATLIGPGQLIARWRYR